MKCLRCIHALTLFHREIQERIEASSSESSIYHKSHATTFTDVTVYPSSTSAYSEEPDTKKRKRATDDAAGTTGSQPLYTGHLKSNVHLRRVHGEIKGDCEELASLCVRYTYMCIVFGG